MVIDSDVSQAIQVQVSDRHTLGKYLFIGPHNCVDEFFVVDFPELMRVKQTENDAKFCRACWKL